MFTCIWRVNQYCRCHEICIHSYFRSFQELHLSSIWHTVSESLYWLTGFCFSSLPTLFIFCVSIAVTRNRTGKVSTWPEFAFPDDSRCQACLQEPVRRVFANCYLLFLKRKQECKNLMKIWLLFVVLIRKSKVLYRVKGSEVNWPFMCEWERYYFLYLFIFCFIGVSLDIL